MRIGIFTDGYEPHVSGVTTSINMLKNALISMGHDVYIVAPNMVTNKFIYDEDKRLVLIPGIKTGIYETKFANIYSTKAIKVIKEWDLDVIHSQTEFGVGTFSRIVAKKLNLPVVHTYHTLYEDYVHYVTHGHFLEFGRKIVIKFTKYFCDKTCEELIVPTVKIKKLFLKDYGIQRKINVIPTGIDTQKFVLNDEMQKNIDKLREQYNLKETDFVIGSVGRIAPEKSFDKLILASKKLFKMNEKFKLMIVGDGPSIDDLKRIVQDHELTDSVIFTGKVAYDLIPSYYNLFNVMTSFSRSETQGLTVIEGLAASVPVVAVNDKSFREMVQDQYNGYLFETDEEYIEHILTLSHSKKLYKDMSINAKNSIYRYSKEVFAADILKIYSKAIDKKKKSEKK